MSSGIDGVHGTRSLGLVHKKNKFRIQSGASGGRHYTKTTEPRRDVTLSCNIKPMFSLETPSPPWVHSISIVGTRRLLHVTSQNQQVKK